MDDRPSRQRMSRRSFITATAAGAGAAVLGGVALARSSGGDEDGGRTIATAASTSRRDLRLRPPALRNPKRLRLTNDYVAAHPSIDLYGNGRDWIIELPDDEPIESTVVLHGRDQARHIVIVGGAIQPKQRTDMATMRRDGEWAVYALRGFSGASGGTFRVRVSQSGAFTDPIAWDAAPSAIIGAVEAVLGAGTVKAVDGPSTPGGPWKFVPAGAALGRVALDLSALEGGATATQPSTNVYRPASGGLLLKQWRGTAHVEGVYVGGDFCDEAVDIQNPWGTAVAQFASFRAEPRFFAFHSDWHHPDGLQCYLGPAELRMERCDLISHGSQALIGQPRQTASPRPLEELRDWWFADVLFEARANGERTPPAAAGTPCYMEDDWPANNNNDAGWQWRMRDCFAARVDVDGRLITDGADLKFFNHYPHPPPPGLTLRARPAAGSFADPAARLSGVNYGARGYGGKRVARGDTRLDGQRKTG
jgi:hypothetical protein